MKSDAFNGAGPLAVAGPFIAEQKMLRCPVAQVSSDTVGVQDATAIEVTDELAGAIADNDVNRLVDFDGTKADFRFAAVVPGARCAQTKDQMLAFLSECKIPFVGV